MKHFGKIDGLGKYTAATAARVRDGYCCRTTTEIHGLKRIVLERKKRKKRDPTMHVGSGAVELVKHGASRYDFSDPYHIAIEMSWNEFALAFAGLELGINIVFALLYLASPGCIANARPGSFSDAFFFSIETLATVGYGTMAPATLYGASISLFALTWTVMHAIDEKSPLAGYDAERLAEGATHASF